MFHVPARLVALSVGVSAYGAPPGYHEIVASDEPLLWYQFGEQSGAMTKNFGSLGADFDGALFNGVTQGVATIGGDSGVMFDAAQLQYVEAMELVPDSLLGNPSFTAEAVVEVFSGAQPHLLWAPYLHWGLAGTGNSVYFSQSWNIADKAYVGFYNGGLRTTGSYDLDSWVHLVWVRNSGGGVNDALTGTTLYLNGEPVALEPDPALCCDGLVPHVQKGPIRVQRADDLTRYFSGIVDEVVLYDTLLTAEDVKARYQALVCLADCDGSGALNILDFVCFQQKFVSGDLGADCDGSGALNILDFVCFQQAFQAGCP